MENAIQIEIEVNQNEGVSMKKIEKNMVDAIENRKDWSNGNTSVNRFMYIILKVSEHKLGYMAIWLPLLQILRLIVGKETILNYQVVDGRQ